MPTPRGNTRFAMARTVAMASESRGVVRAAALTTALLTSLILSGQPASAESRLPAHDFTIEQVLSAPFPSGLVAAGQGGRVAWVFDKAGSRNVWLAEPGANGRFSARPITSYIGDDGLAHPCP